MSEQSLEQQIAIRDSQAKAFRESAVQDALDFADGAISGFIDAMNRVVRNYGGKLPDGVHDAFDRILAKDPKDRQTLVNWLNTQISNVEVSAETVHEILNGQQTGDGTNPLTPQPTDKNEQSPTE